MANFSPAITCLTGTYVTFLTQEAAKLATEVSNIVASFTDPLEKLADTNVKQLTNDITSLTTGNVAGNLASIGEAIIINKIKRELYDLLQDVIQREPAIGDAIQRITNITEAVYGIVSLAVLLRKEAPYSALADIVEDLEELLETKKKILNQMKKNIIQLNNTLQATTNNATTTAALLRDDLETVVDDLGDAETSLLSLEVSMRASPSVYVDKHLTTATSKLTSAASTINPSTETNVLNVTNALAQAAVGSDFLTDAQLKVASYSTLPLAIQIDCQLQAVEKVTKRINFFLTRLDLVVPDYEDSVESASMKNFRLKLLSQLRIRVATLKSDIEKALTDDSISTLALHSLSWSSRIEALKAQAPKIKNQMTSGSEDADRLAQMDSEIDDMLEALADIDGTNVSGGIESTTGLTAQVGTLVGQAKSIMKLMGTSKITQYDIASFQDTALTVASGSSSAIAESLSTIGKIESALGKFSTTPPEDQTLEDLLSLLELMGMDRAKDLLKIGKFKDFLDTTIDDASYIGLAIKCLISVEDIIEDTITLATVTELRELLEGQRISELAAAFDILDSGKNAAILEIKNKIAEGQGNLQKVQRIVTDLRALAAKAGETVSELDEAAEGLGYDLGEVVTGVGGSLNESVSDLDVDGLQGGCLGQLRF